MNNNFTEQDLFNNPMVTAAFAAMSDTEKERYKEIGECMYGHLNFEDSRFVVDPNFKMKEALACIEAQIRSGIHPSYLEENEHLVLEDAYGKEWFKKWGYTQQDLKGIHTLKPQINPV